MLAPDMAQPRIYANEIAPNLKDGAMLLFSHGFNIHYGQITPPNECRRHHGRAERARAIWCAGSTKRAAEFPACSPFIRTLRATHSIARSPTRTPSAARKPGVIQTTFAEETETDLFGEQAVLCGGARELIQAGWETLVEAGYQPESAYFECLHELKLIVDLIYEGGIAEMHQFISETAKYGDLTRGIASLTTTSAQNMKKILEEIQTGAVRQRMDRSKIRPGRPHYSKLLERDKNHPIETVGKELRTQMSWIKPETAAAGKGTRSESFARARFCSQDGNFHRRTAARV